MATQRDSYIFGPGAGGLISDSKEVTSMCCTFTATDSYNCLYPKIKGKRIGSINGSVTVELQTVSSGKPSGAVIASKTVTGSLIPTSVTVMTFTWDAPVIIEQGTQYAIVIRATGCPDGNNYFDWYIENYGGESRGNWGFPTQGGWFMYLGKTHYFEMWGDDLGLSDPTLDYPTDLQTDVYLNSDGLLEMRWSDEDEEDIEYYTVYFGFKNGVLVPQNDRTRYSILTLKMFLNEQLEYDTDYEWGVTKTIYGDEYYSDIFEFRTMPMDPPGPSGTPINGLNGITTIKRLIAVADNKIWYET
jgi:hypothetical protein